MEYLLKRFMFLSYALHLMEVNIDIDEEGLEIAQFDVIDEHLAKYLDAMNPVAMKAELVGLVHTLANMEVDDEPVQR